MSNLLYGPAIETPAIVTDTTLTPRPRGQGVLKLRDYQNEAADCAFDAWREHASTLLTIPTGAGKTLCAAEIICRWPGDKRILFIAHTEELIDQAAQSIAKHFGEMPTIEMGDRSEESGGHPILDRSRVLVASIQTMSRRMERFDPKNFGLVIFDEAHRCHTPGAIVDTVRGQVPIEEIRTGDTVPSWNGSEFVEKPVTSTFRYWYDGPIVDITTPSGTVSVTPSHRMYSLGVKVNARDICVGDSISVPVVQLRNRQHVCRTDAHALESSGHEALPEVPQGYAEGRDCCSQGSTQERPGQMQTLRERVSQGVNRRPHQFSSLKQRNLVEGVDRQGNGNPMRKPDLPQEDFGANEGQEPNGKHGGSWPDAGQHNIVDPIRETGCLREFQKARERRRYDAVGSGDDGAVPVGDLQLQGKSEGRRMATVLQDRHGMASDSDRSGDRRFVAQGPEGSGCEKGKPTSETRLEDPTCDECRGGIWESIVTSVELRHYSGYVYDFEVADTHNYIANGLLSSNSPANSYRRLWKYFQDRNKSIKALLLTATPYRADGITMSCMADSVCYEMDIRDAIDEGWLVTIKQKYVVVKDLDFSSCRTVAKDFNQQDLESVMLGGNNVDGLSENERRDALARQERMLHAVAVPSIEEAAGKPGLVFCVTVEHATRMAEILRRYPGVTAEVIHGAMDKTVRRDLIQRYRKGQIQWLVSVACLNEGFDAPNAAVIVDAAPTKSKNRYVQRVGRGTRPEPGVVDACTTAEERRNAIANSSKPHVTILDFVGSSGKHKLISTADILAGDMPEALVEEAKQDMQRTGKAEEIRQAAWRKKEERDEEIRKREEENRRKKEERRLKALALEEAGRARIRAKVTYEAQNRDPFNKADVAPVQVQPKFRGGSTDQQVRYLACLGIKEETSMTWTKAQAGAVIDKLSNQTGPEYIMRFGRNKGKRLKDIDFEYLRWAGENIKDNAFQDALAVYRQQVINDRKRVAK